MGLLTKKTQNNSKNYMYCKKNLYTQFFLKCFLENTFPQNFFLFKIHFKKKQN